MNSTAISIVHAQAVQAERTDRRRARLHDPGRARAPAGAAARHVRLHLVAGGSAHGQPPATGDGLVLQQPDLPLEPSAVAHQ